MTESIAFDMILKDLGPWIWWGGFLFIFLLYAIFSAIFVYHWREYAIGDEIISRTFRWYFWSTGCFLSITLLSLVWISL